MKEDLDFKRYRPTQDDLKPIDGHLEYSRLTRLATPQAARDYFRSARVMQAVGHVCP